MRYPIAIEPGDNQHAFGVVVPDLPGCFSAGDSLDEAMAQAREAILLYLEGLLDEGKALPRPSPVDMHTGHPDFKGWIWAVVEVDPEDRYDTVERVNITSPKHVHEGGQLCGGEWGNAILVFGACGARDDGTGSRERVRPPSLPGKSCAVAPAIVQARSASLTLRHR